MSTTSLDFIVKNGLQISGNAAVCGMSFFYGNVIMTPPSICLGSVSNIHIDGGASGNVLTTNGSGSLSWVSPTSIVSTATPNSRGIVYGVACSGFPFNTAIGNTAMNSISSGTLNTALGYRTMFYTGYGNENTSIGALSLCSNTYGSNNTGIGTYSLYSNTFGNNNTALGHGTLTSITCSTQNTAIGMNSGCS